MTVTRRALLLADAALLSSASSPPTQPDNEPVPGKPVAYHNGLLSINYGLVWGIVACCFGLLGVPGTHLLLMLGFKANLLAAEVVGTRDLSRIPSSMAMEHYGQNLPTRRPSRRWQLLMPRLIALLTLSPTGLAKVTPIVSRVASPVNYEFHEPIS